MASTNPIDRIMRPSFLFAVLLLGGAIAFSFLYADSAQRDEAAQGIATRHDDAAQIIALERAALDRWGKGDPGGYLEIFTTDITYFNPFLERRKEGLSAMTEYYRPDEVYIDRYDMIDPKVLFYGDVAALSYHLYNYSIEPDGSTKETDRWNSTKIYTRVDGEWKIFHNHWSFLQPELAERVP